MNHNDSHTACHSSDQAQRPGRAKILTPKSGLVIEGDLVACCVKERDRNYLIFEESISWRRTGRYLAIETDFCANATQFMTDHTMMFAAVTLETYARGRFWGWEIHRPTLGDGWNRYPEQNIEHAIAPASCWMKEIQENIIPRIEKRLHFLPRMSRRWLDSPSDDSVGLEDDSEEVTYEDLAERNIPPDGWVPEDYKEYLKTKLRRLQFEEPILRRRLVQASWLLRRLSFRGSAPVQMRRTTVSSLRRFSLPVPLSPLIPD